MEPERKRWEDALPINAPGRRLNFPSFHFLAIRLEYPDAELVAGIAGGMPLVGPIPETPSPRFTRRVKAESLTFDERKCGVKESNEIAIERTNKSQASDLAKIRRRGSGTRQDYAKCPACETRGRECCVSPDVRNYGKTRRTGPKTRLIDDLKASGINSLLSTSDTNAPENLDIFLAITTYYKLVSPTTDLRATVVGNKHAYKNVLLRRGRDYFATIIVVPPEGELVT